MVESNDTAIPHCAGWVNDPAVGSNKAKIDDASSHTNGHTGNGDNIWNTHPVPVAICGFAMRLPGGICNAESY